MMVGRARGIAIVSVLLVAGLSAAPTTLAPRSMTVDAVQSSAGSSIYVANSGPYSYTPDIFENLPTHTMVTVTFVDNSTEIDTHTFTIIGEEGVQLPATTSQAEINQLAFGKSPPPLVNLNVSRPGDSNTSTFESPGTGWYEFLCSQPAHFQFGMYGFVAFGMNLPSNLTLPPSPVKSGGHLNFNPVDAGAIAALVVVFALGYVVWCRRRSPPRTPPESVRHPDTASTESMRAGVGR